MLRAVQPAPGRLDPDQPHPGIVDEGWNRPMALDPPPIAATTASGSFPRRASICRPGLLADHLWKSRTMAG
jgi:hypothetical protein